MVDRIAEKAYRIKNAGQTILSRMRDTNTFKEFVGNRMLIDSIERELLNIAQSLKEVEGQEDLTKSFEAARLVELGELILHSADHVPPEIIWGLIHKELPVLVEKAGTLLPQSK